MKGGMKGWMDGWMENRGKAKMRLGKDGKKVK